MSLRSQRRKQSIGVIDTNCDWSRKTHFPSIGLTVDRLWKGERTGFAFVAFIRRVIDDAIDQSCSYYCYNEAMKVYGATEMMQLDWGCISLTLSKIMARHVPL
jgi:hypothetical protein